MDFFCTARSAKSASFPRDCACSRSSAPGISSIEIPPLLRLIAQHDELWMALSLAYCSSSHCSCMQTRCVPFSCTYDILCPCANTLPLCVLSCHNDNTPLASNEPRCVPSPLPLVSFSRMQQILPTHLRLEWKYLASAEPGYRRLPLTCMAASTDLFSVRFDSPSSFFCAVTLRNPATNWSRS